MQKPPTPKNYDQYIIKFDSILGAYYCFIYFIGQLFPTSLVMFIIPVLKQNLLELVTPLCIDV